MYYLPDLFEYIGNYLHNVEFLKLQYNFGFQFYILIVSLFI
jgi:hypothetical protein